jgi:hypothetical protein
MKQRGMTRRKDPTANSLRQATMAQQDIKTETDILSEAIPNLPFKFLRSRLAVSIHLIAGQARKLPPAIRLAAALRTSTSKQQP